MSARPATKHSASAARGPARNLHVAGSPSGPEESLAARAERVAAVAAKHAAAVDHDSRVPAEAIAAARAERLLGAAIPTEFGGEGASIGDIVDVCYTLGRACASTAMIFAMHQTKVACIARHGRGSAWHQRLMRHIASEQLLLASSTTEGNRGGDLRNSAAPIETHEGRIKLERMATVISYGEVADGISREKTVRWGRGKLRSHSFREKQESTGFMSDTVRTRQNGAPDRDTDQQGGITARSAA